jgi:hypothetical protein
VNTGIQLYTGEGETSWNGYPIDTGGYSCVSPVKGRTERTLAENRVRKVWGNTKVIQDSGAFQDTARPSRLTYEQALARQIAHAIKYNYADNIEYRVSYDLLIDEKVQDGVRVKRRWSVDEAIAAVQETIVAAAYLAEHRHDLNLILSVQGVDAAQYLECAKPVISYMDTSRDSLGLGGWCIIGTRPKQMMPVFRDTIRAVIPYAASKGVQRVHIFGVIYPMALGELLWMCNQHGIAVSTDSTSPANHPFRGQWGYGSWRDNRYQRVDVRERGKERVRHVLMTREWLANLSREAEYQAPGGMWIPNIRKLNTSNPAKTRQLSLPFAA